MSELKQRYKLRTPTGEVVYTEPGKNGPGDMKIFTVFPRIPWMTTLHYMGIVLRLKGMVEDRNYPPNRGYEGAYKLLKFIRDCIVRRTTPIKELCAEYEMPGYGNADTRCACGQPAQPGQRWCKACAEALDLFDAARTT